MSNPTEENQPKPDRYLEALEARGHVSKTGKRFHTNCPNPEHEDRNPSFDFDPSDKTGVCRSRCGRMDSSELAMHLGIPPAAPIHEVSELTIEELSEAKRIPLDKLEQWGVRTGTHTVQKAPCVDIPYMDTKGQVVATNKRISLTGAKRFISKQESKYTLYGLWMLDNIKNKHNLDYVILAEGESDTWTLWNAKYSALGVHGASGWKPEFAEYLEGLQIYVIPDKDKAGEGLVAEVAKAFPDVKVISVPDGYADINDYYLSCDNFIEELKILIEEAVSFVDLQSEEDAKEQQEAFKIGGDLLHTQSLWENLKEQIAHEYVGDLYPALMSYLTLRSAVLPEPINCVFIAPSSTGKNAAIDAGKRFFPHSAYVEVSAGSEKSFIHTKESYKHKTFILSEFDSWPKEGAASSALRSLITDKEMIYDTVESSSEGKPEHKRLIKEGPTGFMSSSTMGLQDQESTRNLQVSLTGSTAQTRLVLNLTALKAAGKWKPRSYEAYVAMNRWISLEQKRTGYPSPIIPYAVELANLLGSKYGFLQQERARRDFAQVVSCIKTVALMHINARGKNTEGRILATTDDYRMASEALEQVIETTQEEGLSKNTRAIVNAIKELASEGRVNCSLTELANHLEVAKSTASKWAKPAIEAGYILNPITDSGKAFSYQIGEALPEGTSLPTKEELEAAITAGSSVTNGETVKNEQETNGLGNTKTGVKQEPFAVFTDS